MIGITNSIGKKRIKAVVKVEARTAINEPAPKKAGILTRLLNWIKKVA